MNELAKKIHDIAISKGFWFEGEKRNNGELIALMHSELSEALEELRKGIAPNYIYYPRNINQDISEVKPEGVPVELADCIIRILDFCAFHKIDIDEAIQIKIDYNKTRPQKHGKVF